MTKQIVIDIKKDGTINIEAVNYTGNECEKATQPFEEVFGLTTEKTYKADFYQKETLDNRIKNQS